MIARGLDVIGSAVSAFLRPLGRTESPRLTLSLSDNASKDRRSGVLVGMPRNAPSVGPDRVGRPSKGPTAPVARACVQEVRFGGLRGLVLGTLPRDRKGIGYGSLHIALFEFE